MSWKDTLKKWWHNIFGVPPVALNETLTKDQTREMRAKDRHGRLSFWVLRNYGMNREQRRQHSYKPSSRHWRKPHVNYCTIINTRPEQEVPRYG